MDEKHKTLKEKLEQAQTITVLTGAGISTESGVPDFRSNNGVYREYGEEKVNQFLSSTYFQKNPKDFWNKYKQIFALESITAFEPNKGHLFLKELEERGKSVHIYTQNIDGLHQKAGSSNVTELHGSISSATCPTCKTKYDLNHLLTQEVPICQQDQTILKPDIVLFGDQVYGVNRAITSASKSDVFLVLGTSLEVYPVNEIPMHISKDGKTHKAIINRVFTNKDRHFHTIIHGRIGETIDKIKAMDS